VTRKRLSSVAFQYAKTIGIEDFGNARKERAGRAWMGAFLKRYKGLLVLKKARNLAKPRAIFANKKTIHSWFKKFEKARVFKKKL